MGSSPTQTAKHSTHGGNDLPKAQLTIQEATSVCQEALQRGGYSSEQAWTITDHLIDAEMRGHPFAGLARALSILEQIKNPEMRTDQEIEVTRSGPTYAHLDGHNNVGNLVAYQATKIGIEKAKRAGISVVGANGFWYSGNLSYYAEMATREDLVVLIASNGSRIVAPHGGYEAKFCTNPFCIGIPTTRSDEPIIWDIGTSNIMYAQAVLADRLGTKIPEGSAYDSAGQPTIDPLKAMQGALSAWGGHKGTGLAIMVQLLGIVAGSTEPTPFMSDFGFLVITFDPSILQSLDRVKQDAEKFSRSIRETKMLPGQAPARMPYDGSIGTRKEVQNKGWMFVDKEVIDQLRNYGRS